MKDLFISYARENQAHVERLNAALGAQDRSVWVDLEGIPPTAEWLPEIYAGIDASQAFAFVISPASLKSRVCGLELKHAVDQNKRLIPLVYEDAGDAEIPQCLRELNWIFIRESDDFEKAVDTLLEAIDTDLDRVRGHTRLLMRAREWEKREHHSLLLRSRDLVEAETQFVAGAELEPRPTPLQLRYVTASRCRATAVQRTILGAVTFGMVVATTLAIVAWVQREYSSRREVAAVVRNIAPAKPRDALALAVNAMGQWFANDVPEVRSSLLSALQAPKHMLVFARDSDGPVAGVAIAQDGAVAAVADARFASNDEPTLTVWSADGKGQASAQTEALTVSVAGCSIEPLLLVVSASGDLQVRNLATGDVRAAAPPGATSGIDAAQPQTQDSSLNPNATAPPPVDSYATAPPPVNSYDAPPLVGVYETPPDLPPIDQPDEPSAGSPTASSAYDTGAVPGVAPLSPSTASFCAAGPGSVHLASFSADCTTIVIGRQCATEVWLRNPELRLEASVPEARTPRSIAVDAGGQTIVRGYGDGAIRMATASRAGGNYIDAEFVRQPGGRPVDALALSPDGATVAGADGDSIRLWHRTADAMARGGTVFFGHEDKVTSVAFEPAGGAFVVSGSRDNSLRVWDIAGNALSDPLRGHDSWIRSVAVSADGRSIVSGSNDGTVRRWQVPMHLSEVPCGRPSAPVRVLATSDDRRTRLVQVPGSTAKSSWDLVISDAACARIPVADGPGVQLGSLTPDGRFVAFASQGAQKVVLRDLSGGAQDIAINYPSDGLRAIAISADGTTLAGAGAGGTVHFVRRGDSSWYALSGGHDLPVVSLAFARDGRFIASGSEDNSVAVWDMDSGKMTTRLTGHKGWVSAIAFSLDGRYLVTGSWDKTLRLWETAGHPMGSPYRGHSDWVTHAGFDTQAAVIISHGNDQKTGTWQGGEANDWMRAAHGQLSGQGSF